MANILFWTKDLCFWGIESMHGVQSSFKIHQNIILETKSGGLLRIFYFCYLIL